MPFITEVEEEIIDLDTELKKEEAEKKTFISDPSNAVGIISAVLSKSPQKELDKVEDIK